MATGDWLREIPYFAGLSDSELSQLQHGVREREYQAGEILFLEGEDCLGLYIVRTGRIRIFKTSPAGKDQALTVVHPLETFNDVPVFDDGANPASADALVDSIVALLPKRDTARLLQTQPAFAAGMLRAFALRLRHLTSVVEELSFHHLAARVARAVLESAGDRRATELTQQRLAEVVGTAREVAGRALRQMEGQGLIRIQRGRTEILNRAALEQLAAGRAEPG